MEMGTRRRKDYKWACYINSASAELSTFGNFSSQGFGDFKVPQVIPKLLNLPRTSAKTQFISLYCAHTDSYSFVSG